MVCGCSPQSELAKRHMQQAEAESRKPKARQATNYKRKVINQAQTFFVLHTFLFPSIRTVFLSYFLFLISYFFSSHAQPATERLYCPEIQRVISSILHKSTHGLPQTTICTSNTLIFTRPHLPVFSFFIYATFAALKAVYYLCTGRYYQTGILINRFISFLELPPALVLVFIPFIFVSL
jgi:hypothetical protein